jgi:SAM-dependent methyltransferase
MKSFEDFRIAIVMHIWWATAVLVAITSPTRLIAGLIALSRSTKTGLAMSRGALSTDEICALVQRRDEHRAVMEYKEADNIKHLLESMNIVIKDVSYKCDGNSVWSYKDYIVEPVTTDLMEIAHNCFEEVLSGGANEAEIGKRVKAALRLQRFAVDSVAAAIPSIGQSVIPTIAVSSEMQGRKYADAAFEFSLAGIADNELFLTLADNCAAELQRFAHRKSCGPLQIIQIVEKLLVAGVRSHAVFSIADELLHAKNSRIRSSDDLFAGRALLWLWRHATKQTKPTKGVTALGEPAKSGQAGAVIATEGQRCGIPNLSTPAELFADPALPLVVDLGCGYGVSLLSLCEQSMRDCFPQKFNFLGADLSNRAVRYASGISKRWGQTGQAAFVYADCNDAMRWVRDHYPGPVALVMVNFPTPYGVDAVLGHGLPAPTGDAEAAAASAGNAQLPTGFDNFMFSAELADLVREVLAGSSWTSPLLLLQSNVEDVVVTMRNIVEAVQATELPGNGRLTTSTVDMAHGALLRLFGSAAVGIVSGWRTLEQLVDATDPVRGGGRVSQRLQTWLEGIAVRVELASTSAHEGVGARTRAFGSGWLDSNPLPGNARTETEVHCEVDKQPVHRTLFVYSKLS